MMENYFYNSNSYTSSPSFVFQNGTSGRNKNSTKNNYSNTNTKPDFATGSNNSNNNNTKHTLPGSELCYAGKSCVVDSIEDFAAYPASTTHAASHLLPGYSFQMSDSVNNSGNSNHNNHPHYVNDDHPSGSNNNRKLSDPSLDDFYNYCDSKDPGDKLVDSDNESKNPNKCGSASSQNPQTVKGSPITVNWLRQNYEPHPEYSLPRSLLYSHYKSHCYSVGIFAMNSASFGKLIRTVFPNLKTRRLGTRGNSKYHYDGIRVRAGSYLVSDGDDFVRMNMYTLEDSSANGGTTGGFATKNCLLGSLKNSESSHGDFNGNADGTADSEYYCNDDEKTLAAILAQEILKEQEEFPINKKFVNVEKLEIDIPLLKSFIEVEDFDVNPLPDSAITVATTVFREYFRDLMENLKNIRYASACKSAFYFWSCIDKMLECEQISGNNSNVNTEMILSHPMILKYIDETEMYIYQAINDAFQPGLQLDVNDSYMLTLRRFGYLFEIYNKWVLHHRPIPVELVKIKQKNIDVLTHLIRRDSSMCSLFRGAKKAFISMQEMSISLADVTEILDFRYIFQLHCVSFKTDPNYWSYLSLLKAIKLVLDEDSKTSMEVQVFKVLHKILDIKNLDLDQFAGSGLSNPKAIHFWQKCLSLNQRFHHLNFLILKQMTMSCCDNYGAYHLMIMFCDSYIIHAIERIVEKYLNLSSMQQISHTFQSSFSFHENEFELKEEILLNFVES